MVHRIREFEQWQPGYHGAVVRILKANTSSLAQVFKDEALTLPADNPQVLLSYKSDGLSYGKFAQPLYLSDAYTLDIEGGHQTGVQRPPLLSLNGENASSALVQANGGVELVALKDVIARVVYATDFGALGQTTAVNTATLTSAIGAAAQKNGGVVVLPSGNYQFSQLNIPAGVILHGQGVNATVLRSQTNDKVITLSGKGGGLSNLTLDGVDLQAGSIGVYSKAIDETVFQDCLIKRFETGFYALGGRRSRRFNFSIEDCTRGAMLHGDSDASNGADGDEFRHNSWIGGQVSYCTDVGIDLSYEDQKCWLNSFEDIGFEDNAGTAFKVNGARWTDLKGCWWKGNTTNLDVADDDDTDSQTENTVIGLTIENGSIESGAINFKGHCQDIVFKKIGLFGVAIELTLPENPILLSNCVEDNEVTLTGDGSKLIRWRDINHGASAGVTSDDAATKAWSVSLEPGQVGFFRAVVLANQKDGTNTAEYNMVVSAVRAGSELSYDSQVQDFTVGEILTGAVSGAQALITKDTDDGATGTLTLRNIIGEFENNEQITDPLGGDALANGTLVAKSVAIKGSENDLRADREDVAGLNATFVANGEEVELRVTGEAEKTYEWHCFVDAVVS
ncbi:glycosyl hydrolase family 28-related protein [Terasakiella pusilla]|uniref:glycosyl hydrolase family 28-related protein n=1 Tax=Terasakiella pusilla TaxID=64973 RepID=UPI003AA87F7A